MSYLLARKAYQAYAENVPGAPEWGQLTDTMQRGWEAAVAMVTAR
jgi:hypothetical protein